MSGSPLTKKGWRRIAQARSGGARPYEHGQDLLIGAGVVAWRGRGGERAVVSAGISGGGDMLRDKNALRGGMLSKSASRKGTTESCLTVCTAKTACGQPTDGGSRSTTETRDQVVCSILSPTYP